MVTWSQRRRPSQYKRGNVVVARLELAVLLIAAFAVRCAKTPLILLKVMVYKCSVFGCKGNYLTGQKVSIFRFPKDPKRRKIWETIVRREDFKATASSRICELHFRKEDIIREIEFFHQKSGTMLIDTLQHPKLRQGAIPIPMSDEYLHSLQPTMTASRPSTVKCRKRLDTKLVPKAQDSSIETSSATTSKEDDKKTDHIPLEPAIEIKEEPVDYEPTPSTSTEAANEEFILPHEENTWTPPVQPPPNPAVEPQFTLSVASLAAHNNPETSTSDGEKQVGKKRKIKSSTFVPSTNGSEVRPESPVYNLGDASNPGSLKELRKDQFDVFGEYIAAKLRSLDKRSCAYAQKSIGDIIFQAEMGTYLNEDSESKVLNNSAS